MTVALAVVSPLENECPQAPRCDGRQGSRQDPAGNRSSLHPRVVSIVTHAFVRPGRSHDFVNHLACFNMLDARSGCCDSECAWVGRAGAGGKGNGC